MTDTDIRVLSIPFHKDLLAKIEGYMNEEFDKVKQPVQIEAYVHGILVNFVLNREMQLRSEAAQKELQRALRTEITVYSNANAQALRK